METLPIVRMLASLSVTLGLMFLLAWAYRRFGNPFQHAPKKATESRLTVLESARLTPTTTLYLVKDGTTEHLLAVTGAQTTVIRSTPAAKPAKVKA